MGPNAVAFGIRPLDALHGSAFDADFLADHDLGAYHENVFWTNSKGALYNSDYSPNYVPGGNNNGDPGFSGPHGNISSYRFSDSYSIGSANISAAINPSGFSGSNYNLITHNCQDYSNAVRQNLNIDPWHN